MSAESQTPIEPIVGYSWPMIAIALTSTVASGTVWFFARELALILVTLVWAIWSWAIVVGTFGKEIDPSTRVALRNMGMPSAVIGGATSYAAIEWLHVHPIHWAMPLLAFLGGIFCLVRWLWVWLFVH